MLIKKQKTNFMLKAGISLLLGVFIFCTLTGCRKEVFKTSKESAGNFYNNKYNITDKGLSELEKMLRKCTALPDKLTVQSFDAVISTKAIVQNFDITLCGFNSQKQYTGTYSFYYDENSKKIKYLSPNSNPASNITISYNANSDITYLDSQLKKLPLEKQIGKLNFDKYVLRYQSNTKLSPSDPIIDGSTGQEFPVLSLKDYSKGLGGTSDGHTAVIFTLYDGVSLISKNLIHYRCKPSDTSALSGNRDFTMQCDYQLINNKISFTRDYGETWITANIPKTDLSKTMSFYRNGTIIPEGSYFISTRKDEPIAFFYGANPSLRISKDNGKNWRTVLFNADLDRDITKRIIGFTSKTEGYAALGTDWSMGAGEGKLCFMTHDGGTTWEEKKLPLSGTSQTLEGLCFSDKNNGIVSLKSESDESWPVLYFTQDGANNWTQINLPWDQIPKTIDYLSKADSLTYDNGVYTLTLGQGSGRNKKVCFQSLSLSSGWKFIKEWTAVTHTVG